MLAEYNARLDALEKSAERKIWIDGKLKALYAELKEMERQYDSMRVRLSSAREEWDWIHFGFKGIYYALEGTRGERLRKKKAEIDSLSAQVEEADRAAGLIRKAMNALEEEKKTLEAAAAEYEKTLLRKKTFLVFNRLCSEEMKRAMDRQKLLAGQLARLKEAWDSGDRIMDQIRRISNHLSSAENSGRQDIFSGGVQPYGVGPGYRKHWHLADAQSEYRQLQKMIADFGTEMTGVASEIKDISFEMGGFALTVDLLFDNIFTDRAILNRIRSAKAQFKSVRDQMWIVMETLMARRRELDQEKQNLDQQLRKMIADAGREAAYAARIQ